MKWTLFLSLLAISCLDHSNYKREAQKEVAVGNRYDKLKRDREGRQFWMVRDRYDSIVRCAGSTENLRRLEQQSGESLEAMIAEMVAEEPNQIAATSGYAKFDSTWWARYDSICFLLMVLGERLPPEEYDEVSQPD